MQSGDALTILIGVLTIIAASAILFFLIRRSRVNATSAINTENVANQKPRKIMNKAIIVVALASMLIATFALLSSVAQIKAFGNTRANETNVVKITVNDDGSLTIPEGEITNTLDKDLILKNSTYQITDSSVTDILAKSNLNVEGLGGTLFDGSPNTEYVIQDTVRHFKSGDTEKLNIKFVLKNPADALSLCDKTPINLTINCDYDEKAIASINLGEGQIVDETKIPEG